MEIPLVRHCLTTRHLNHHTLLPKTRLPGLKFREPINSRCHSTSSRSVVDAFDPTIPLSRAQTPPSSWYTDPSFLDLEFDRVFFRGWQTVGFTAQVENPNQFFTGRLGALQFVVCRDADGILHAFHNVCRHHGSVLASDCGLKTCFVCPYHGWTYGLNGQLLKATHITGIQDFNEKDYGLVPLKVATWGPFILISMDKDLLHHQDKSIDIVGNQWLGDCSEMLSMNKIDTNLKHICRREYTIKCNWKVFCDNYLDGGYHVPYAHRDLASGLTMDSYSTTIFEKVSIQRCESAVIENGDDFDRLGAKAFYAFVYPNFMINRYGHWMDTNLVVPLGPQNCQVIIDYFLDPYIKVDANFITRSLEESEKIQMEDIGLCEGVQKGLESPLYSTGRYSPSLEKAMHHFHCLLHDKLIGI
ncbi:Choline monooxygenase, chloroplastic [Zostera marina]|uniref:Choline monooxygenase, chloroplastic n=1 Tax=Zostera marina TaxID=29655 RepID=A0A0K9PVK1_ZOSMR|nr:Choline monooxygenase, chloroplastic [Zostera marina]